MKSPKFFLTVLYVLAAMIPATAAAQSTGRILFGDSPEAVTDTAGVKELRLDVDALLFLRNDEFETPLQSGYTLPGFRMRPTLTYRPSPTVNVEAGLYALRYWGADSYPNAAYRDLPFASDDRSRTFHILPVLRASMSTPWGLTVVLGTLYGGESHRLPEPLYAPELNLTADPEAGVQLLYDNPRVHADLWVNWESFIYRADRHQEVFLFGLSGQAHLTRPGSAIDLYAPLSLLTQHRGGEVDSTDTGVQTLLNASVGLGLRHDFKRRALGEVGAEAHFLVYRQVAGDMWPHDSGTAWYLHGWADVGPVRFKLGYQHSHRFISLLGYPLFGTLGTTPSAYTYNNMSTVVAGADFHHTFHPGYTLGAGIDFYHQPESTGWSTPLQEWNKHKASTSFCFGIYMRLSPSFLLKRFK